MSARLSGQRRLCFISLTSSARANATASVIPRCKAQYSSWLACRSTHPIPSTSLRFPGHAKRRFHAQSRRLASSRDPYQVLGVNKDAKTSDIKKSYFELARKYHPDSNKDPGAKDKFIEIQQAYDTLSDDKKRAAYDQFGAASQQPGFDPDAFANARGPFGAGGFGGFQDFANSFGDSSGGAQSEIFEQLFGAFGGGGRSRSQRARGEDIEATINISFLDACKGVSRMVETTPVVDCKRCSGSGLKAGKKRAKCSSCGGTGTRTYVIDSGFHMASTCTTCQGSGTYVSRDSQCEDCGGIGRVRTAKAVHVDVPPGVEDGMVIRVGSAGSRPVGSSGPSGDLLLRVNVASSKIFQRQGMNLLQQVRIPLHKALLGGRIKIPTLDGDVELKISAGTQPGEEAILKGRGVTSVGGGSRGDMFVSFQVQLPRTLTGRQRELIELYADDVEGRSGTRTAPKDKGGGEGTSSGGAPSKKEEQTSDRTESAERNQSKTEPRVRTGQHATG